MSRSEVEKIYNAWSTKAHRAIVSDMSRKSGEFDKYLSAGGFKEIGERLHAFKRSHGTLKTAEQAWKLLEKFKRRHSETIAFELLKKMKLDPELASMLLMFPASMFPALSDEAKATGERLDLKNL